MFNMKLVELQIVQFISLNKYKKKKLMEIEKYSFDKF